MQTRAEHHQENPAILTFTCKMLGNGTCLFCSGSGKNKHSDGDGDEMKNILSSVGAILFALCFSAEAQRPNRVMEMGDFFARRVGPAGPASPIAAQVCRLGTAVQVSVRTTQRTGRTACRVSFLAGVRAPPLLFLAGLPLLAAPVRAIRINHAVLL
jgi:hypothetical protein